MSPLLFWILLINLVFIGFCVVVILVTTLRLKFLIGLLKKENYRLQNEVAELKLKIRFNSRNVPVFTIK
jgi:hypothetical protein